MRLVVIGGNAAGMSAAARARRIAAAAEIVVCEKGPQVSYGACGLPYFAEGRARAWTDLVAATAAEFRTERGIDVRENAEVVEVQHARRRVRLASGEELGYDKLIVATGAAPVRIAGLDGPRTFSLYNLHEAIRLRAHLDASPPGRALIVGAGYLGLEAADALRHRGWRVEVVHAGEHLLHRADPWLTTLVGRHLERCGVHVRHGVRVTAAPESADLVLVAAGVRPNVTLAAQAGVRAGITGAIEVNERLETSVAGVYAAGDCAETMHLVTGRPAWIPLGTTANKMGRVAGASAAGGRERFHGVVGTAIVKVGGLGVAVSGLSAAQARREGFQPVEAQIEAAERPKYFRGRKSAVKLIADRSTGRLLGGVVVGEDGVAGRINTIATALTQRMTVEEFAQLDLAYAPPFATVWDPVLIAAQQLLKEL